MNYEKLGKALMPWFHELDVDRYLRTNEALEKACSEFDKYINTDELSPYRLTLEELSDVVAVEQQRVGFMMGFCEALRPLIILMNCIER